MPNAVMTRTRRVFPTEFSAALTAGAQRSLDRSRATNGSIRRPGFVGMPGMIRPQLARQWIAALDERLRPVVTRVTVPIPRDSIARMRHNYSEKLEKTMRVRTAYLEGTGSRAYRALTELGMIAMMKSESLHRFAQHVTSLQLRPTDTLQVLCYEVGDYVGAHNDHHPEIPEYRQGYVDVHISLPNRAVLHQFVVYERSGHFSESAAAHDLGAVNVYRLPFWHYVTPLVAKPGQVDRARRWLLLASFEIASLKKSRGTRPQVKRK